MPALICSPSDRLPVADSMNPSSDGEAAAANEPIEVTTAIPVAAARSFR
ncbi:hypothetical protein ACFXPA_21555 [Amycolatopsis sp. NPDC059090]